MVTAISTFRYLGHQYPLTGMTKLSVAENINRVALKLYWSESPS